MRADIFGFTQCCAASVFWRLDDEHVEDIFDNTSALLHSQGFLEIAAITAVGIIAIGTMLKRKNRRRRLLVAAVGGGKMRTSDTQPVDDNEAALERRVNLMLCCVYENLCNSKYQKGSNKSVHLENQ